MNRITVKPKNSTKFSRKLTIPTKNWTKVSESSLKC